MVEEWETMPQPVVQLIDKRCISESQYVWLSLSKKNECSRERSTAILAWRRCRLDGGLLHTSTRSDKIPNASSSFQAEDIARIGWIC
jgi:hypothetical protein